MFLKQINRGSRYRGPSLLFKRRLFKSGIEEIVACSQLTADQKQQDEALTRVRTPIVSRSLLRMNAGKGQNQSISLNSSKQMHNVWLGLGLGVAVGLSSFERGTSLLSDAKHLKNVKGYKPLCSWADRCIHNISSIVASSLLAVTTSYLRRTPLPHQIRCQRPQQVLKLSHRHPKICQLLYEAVEFYFFLSTL